MIGAIVGDIAWSRFEFRNHKGKEFELFVACGPIGEITDESLKMLAESSSFTDDTVMTVAIAESYLAVPNVFKPNGDCKNDEFRVAYRSLREFHCWVYNRWGKLVYAWDDPAKGWDGTINGRPAAEGAYFYVIRALGTDAPKNAQYIGLKASYQKKKANADDAVVGVYQLSGDINLLRGKK